MQFTNIFVELTSHCNFKCKFCPDPFMQRTRGMMDMTTFNRVIEQIKQYSLTDTINFHLMGEPSLHPKIVEAARIAREAGIKIDLTTNGSLMKTATLDQLLDLGVDHILFSAQTPTKKSFSLRQVKMDFDRYKNNIVTCVAHALNREHNTKISLAFLTTPIKFLMPTVHMHTIDTKEQLVACFDDWMKDILEKIDDNGPNKAIKNQYEIVKQGIASMKMMGWNDLRITENFSLETRILGDWVHESLTAEKYSPAKYGSCRGLTEYMGVLWNGDLVYCCVDYEGKTKFGNVNKTTIYDALQQKRVQESLNGFKKCKVTHEYCQRCLGDVSPYKSWVRQLGSIFYFKFYRRFWETKRTEVAPLLKSDKPSDVNQKPETDKIIFSSG